MAADEWWKPHSFQVTDSASKTPLDRLRDQLAQNDQLRGQFARLQSRLKGRIRVVEIPVVVKPKSESLDDAEILVIGDVVSWPDGTARKALVGEVAVITASFTKQKRPGKELAPDLSEIKRKSNGGGLAVNERSRRHTEMDISIHESEAQGERPSMQDRYVIHLFNGIAVFGLFDGHAGTTAADFASRALIPALKAQFKRANESGVQFSFTESNPQPPDAIERETIGSMKTSLINAVADMERETIELCQREKDRSGTTLCVCLCTRSTLLVANVGDSRVVVSRKGVAKVITKDHRIDDRTEVERVTQSGGFVNAEGYVGGLVQVSRSLGDVDPDTSKKILGLSAEPDIYEFPLDKDKDEFIIMACDGLWDVVSNQGAVQHVRASLKTSKGDMIQATDDLVNKALAQKTTDNVTVMVAYLPMAEKIWSPPLHQLNANSPSPACDDSERPRFFTKKT